MDDYLPLAVMFVLAVGFVAMSIGISKLLAPSRPTSAKDAPYESGIIPVWENPQRFPVSFFLVAMIFVIFDIEIIFLYPWAVIYRELGAYGLWAMVLFTVPILASFAWEISQGGLDWGPRRHSARLDGTVDAERTIESTIRRVPSREQVRGEAEAHQGAEPVPAGGGSNDHDPPDRPPGDQAEAVL